MFKTESDKRVLVKVLRELYLIFALLVIVVLTEINFAYAVFPYPWWEPNTYNKFLMGPHGGMGDVTGDTFVQMGPSKYYYVLDGCTDVYRVCGYSKSKGSYFVAGREVHWFEVDWSKGDYVLQVTKWNKDRTVNSIHNVYLTHDETATAEGIKEKYFDMAEKRYERIRNEKWFYG